MAYAALPHDSSVVIVEREVAISLDESWAYDTDDEFLSAYAAGFESAKYHAICPGAGDGFSLACEDGLWGVKAQLTVQRHSRSEILSLVAILEEAQDEARVAAPQAPPPPPPRIFIGHGRNSAWRDVKDHLADKHGYDVIAYETGARAGHTIRDVLDDMLTEANFAVLVFTAEDEQSDGEVRPRQNVVHEAGLFQGKLGWHKAVLLVEDGTEVLSNLDGIQQIRFPKAGIGATLGEILATLRREFPEYR